MTGTQKNWLIGVLAFVVALLLGVGGYFWFQANYEKKPFTVPVEKNGKRAFFWHNKMQPLVEYLRASGYRVEQREGMRFFSELPPPGDILFLRDLPYVQRDTVHNMLFQWTQNGGHLVAAIMHIPVEPDKALYQKIGIKEISTKATNKKLEGDGRLYLHTEAGGHRLKIDLGGTVPKLACLPGKTAEWVLTGELERVITKKPKKKDGKKTGKKEQPKSRVEQVAEVLSEKVEHKRLPAPGNFIQHHKVGRGTATILTTSTVFHDSGLDLADNAFLLTTTIKGIPAGKPPTIWVWLPDNIGVADSLTHQLLTGYPRLLLGLFLLFLLILWSRQARLRPPEPLATEARRDVLDYFTGWGRFAWRINRAQALLAGNRENLARACRTRPGKQENGAEEANDSAGLQAVALERPARTEADLERISRAMLRLEQRLKTNPEKTEKRNRT